MNARPAALLIIFLGIIAALAVSLRYPRKPNGWEFFPNEPYRLENRRIEVIHGRRVGGGCEFTTPPLSAGPGDPLPESRMLGIDHRDCTILMETGIPSTRRSR